MSLSEIEQLIAQKEHILAIKKYKELHNCTLPIAKSSVQHYRESGSWPSEDENDSSKDLIEVELLIREKKIVNAIKLYREITGKHLSQSKMEVEHFRDTGEWKQLSGGETSEFKDGDSVPAQYFLDKRKEMRKNPEMSKAFKASMILLVCISVSLIVSSIYFFILKD